MAEAPAWQGTSYGGYDYAALGASADRLVLRVAAYQKESDGFPIAPLDPPEEVYYALGELKDTVSADRLSLLVTTTATAWDSEGDRTGTLSGEELQELLEKRGHHPLLLHPLRLRLSHLRCRRRPGGVVPGRDVPGGTDPAGKALRGQPALLE